MWKFAELGAIPNLPAVDHHVILMVHRNHRRVIVMAGARHLSMMGMGDETVAHGLALVPDEKGRGKETNEAVAGIDRKGITESQLEKRSVGVLPQHPRKKRKRRAIGMLRLKPWLHLVKQQQITRSSPIRREGYTLEICLRNLKSQMSCFANLSIRPCSKPGLHRVLVAASVMFGSAQRKILRLWRFGQFKRQIMQ